MRSSCIRQPQNNRYIQVWEWQVAFCQGNHCAAFVLSHFIAWHNWKLNHDEYYRRVNNIAELHGDGRPHEQNAYLFFSMDEISDGILGAYGKNTINNALQLLEELGAISVHKNPNPRYHFDKTKYFIFYPDVCNDWIEKSNSKNEDQKDPPEQINDQSLGNSDHLKVSDRSSKIKSPSSKSNLPSLKKGRAITDTTSKDQFNNKSEKAVSHNIAVKQDAQDISNDFSKIIISEKNPIHPNFYPNPSTIILAQNLGLPKVTDDVEINKFIAYNQAIGSLWADYNPIFIKWLEQDKQKENAKQQEPSRRITHERRTYKNRNFEALMAEVFAANSGAQSPSASVDSFCFIDAEPHQLALVTNDCNLRSAFCE